MTRRQFVFLTVLLAAVGGVDTSFWRRRADGLRAFSNKALTGSEIRKNLLGIFSNAESPRQIGARYLTLYPDEATRSLMLAEDLKGTRVRTSGALRQVLAQKCESDFLNGDLVSIDGFLLARTEAEACALTVLL